MSDIIISPVVLATLFGKTETEVAEIFTKDGQPKTPEEVGQILTTHVTEKIERFKPSPKDKQENRDRIRREVQTEVNNHLVSLGATTGSSWKDQISELTNKEVSEKEPSNAQIMASEFYKNGIKAKEDLYEAEKLAHETTVKNYNEKESTKNISANTSNYIRDEKNMFVISENKDISDTQLANYQRELTTGDTKIIYVDGVEKVVDAEGNPAMDAGHNPLSVEAHRANVAKKYFVKRVANHKDAPKIIVDDQGKAINFPVMETEADLMREVDKEAASENPSSKRIRELQEHYNKHVKPKQTA